MSSRTELAPDKFRDSGRESSLDCAKKSGTVRRRFVWVGKQLNFWTFGKRNMLDWAGGDERRIFRFVLFPFV